MTVEYRTGDLFKQSDVNALAHGVNCHGVMGAGIALIFKHRYPIMYNHYKLMCELDMLWVGDVMPWRTDVDQYVFNIASQDLPGPHASLEALELGLMQAAVWAHELKLPSIALPRIGAGIGGLKWVDAKEVIESVAHHVPGVRLIVVALPGEEL